MRSRTARSHRSRARSRNYCTELDKSDTYTHIIGAFVSWGDAMLINRRGFLGSCFGTIPVAMTGHALAQGYPQQPVRILVPVAPGGTPDLTSRIIANWLSERFEKQFFVENRAGASGNIAKQALLRAPPDGHTLLVTGPNSAADFLQDVRGVASLVSVALVVVVNQELPIRTVPEMQTWSRTNHLNM